MNEIFWSWVIIGMGVLELLLALWVFQKDPKSPIHWHFSIFAFFFSAWTLINGIEILIFPSQNLDLWDRLLFAAVYAGSFFLLHFARVYPVPQPSRFLAISTTIFFFVILVLLFFTDTIITEPFRKNTANQQWLYPLYIIGFLFNWLMSVWMLFRSSKMVVGAIRKQIRLLLIAIVAGSLLGMFESFVMPYFGRGDYNISQLWSPGVAFIIFVFSVLVLRMAFKRPEIR